MYFTRKTIPTITNMANTKTTNPMLVIATTFPASGAYGIDEVVVVY